MHRRLPTTALLCAALFALVTHVTGALADPRDARTAEMISNLSLIEAPNPIRESKGWKKPQVVLMRAFPEAERPWIQAAAPGVRIVYYGNEAEAIEGAKDAEAVLGTCSAGVMKAGANIRWIQTFNAGVENCLAIPIVRERKPLITNMQRIGAPPMADHVMAMLLTFSRSLGVYAAAQRQGQWRPDDPVPGVGEAGSFGLEGKTMFIAGLGGTGLEVAKRASAFGMKIIATRNSSRDAPPFVSHVGLPDEMPDLVAQADVVVNTLPLTDATRGLFNARIFGRMKKSAYFFNVGRGGTVVTADLVEALRSKTIAGAGLDVVDPEPLPSDHPLWKLPNVIITPHVAADTDDQENRLLMARENLRRYVAGEKMLSVVDLAKGY
jgi:phosphoglycerate dehydrogenase-like enzyme